MSLFSWFTRCSGGIACFFLVCFSVYVLWREALSETRRPVLSGSSFISIHDLCTISFAYHSLVLHVLFVLFATRACWGILDITLRIRASSQLLARSRTTSHRRDSTASCHSDDTLTSPHTPSLCANEMGGFGSPPPSLIHAIIIPNYKEEIEILQETLEVLASHPQARQSYDVYLAMEQRETNATLKSLALIQDYVKQFRGLALTLHPSNIPGEALGKGSNIAWAARKLSHSYPSLVRSRVMITVIDADSHLPWTYFSVLDEMHSEHPDTAHNTLYSVPLIFDRNAHEAPAIVRVADIMWAAAGLSGLYRGSSIGPPTSVYSLLLELADRVGGWDTGPEAIGEDLHMYLKCFFALHGNLTCRSIPSPVSQTNVVSDSSLDGISGVVMDVRARYNQALRHMWGALDSGYAARKLLDLWLDRYQTRRAFRPLHASLGDGFDNCMTDHDMERNPVMKEDGAPDDGGIFCDVSYDTVLRPNWTRTFLLCHRLFEAHFLPLQLTIVIATSTLYVWLHEGQLDPLNLNWIFDFTNSLRVVGLVEFAFFLFMYEYYHKRCVETREAEMKQVGLADKMKFSHRSLRKNLIDYIVVPLVGPLYGALPAFQAQMCHFWTQDLVYTVSKKAVFVKGKLDTSKTKT